MKVVERHFGKNFNATNRKNHIDFAGNKHRNHNGINCSDRSPWYWFCNAPVWFLCHLFVLLWVKKKALLDFRRAYKYHGTFTYNLFISWNRSRKHIHMHIYMLLVEFIFAISEENLYIEKYFTVCFYFDSANVYSKSKIQNNLLFIFR